MYLQTIIHLHNHRKDHIKTINVSQPNYDPRKMFVLIDMYCLNKILCNKTLNI